MSGLLLEKTKKSNLNEVRAAKLKKIIVAISFVINLSILFYFKYFNFVFELLSKAFNKINIQLNMPVVDDYPGVSAHPGRG